MVPVSLYDNYKMIWKSNKGALGQYLKKLCNLTVAAGHSNNLVVIDGGWLLHQLSSYSGCDASESKSKEYFKLIPKARDRVVVAFGGYAPSTKDHEHKRRANDFCPDN